MQLRRHKERGAPFLAGGFAAMAAVAVLVCLATGACVPPAPQPTPAPAPQPAPAPAPPPPPAAAEMPTPPPANWMDAPQAPGDWRYRSTGATTRASFGEAGGAPSFEMVCEGGKQVVLLRQGTGGAAMRILTEATERTLPAAARDGAMAAALPSRDPLLDAIAFSKGRFAVEAAGLPTLILPAWPEVTRVVEDCR